MSRMGGFYRFWLIAGSFIMLIGGIFCYVSLVSPPSRSYDPSYHGFMIARNATDSTTDSMTIVLRINPSTLYFRYLFDSNINGTHNFVFWFPFRIIGNLTQESEKLSVNTTDNGSVVSLRHNTILANRENNVRVQQEISGWFTIDDTFTTGSKGVYTITIPFGMGVDNEVFDRTTKELNVSYYTTNDVTLHVDLPYAYEVTSSFPPLSTGIQQWNPTSDKTILTYEWNFDGLGETVIVRYEDHFEIRCYETALFIGGIIFGVGSSLFVRVGYDWSKTLGKNRKDKY